MKRRTLLGTQTVVKRSEIDKPVNRIRHAAYRRVLVLASNTSAFELALEIGQFATQSCTNMNDSYGSCHFGMQGIHLARALLSGPKPYLPDSTAAQTPSRDNV